MLYPYEGDWKCTLQKEKEYSRRKSKPFPQNNVQNSLSSQSFLRIFFIMYINGVRDNFPNSVSFERTISRGKKMLMPRAEKGNK